MSGSIDTDRGTISRMAERANTVVEGMERARALTGADVPVDEAVAAQEAFMAWCQERNLRGSLGREIEGGSIVWVLKVRTGRGHIDSALDDPRGWHDELIHLGLD